MTTPSPDQPLTTVAFLFGVEDSVDALARALDEKAVLRPIDDALNALKKKVSQTGRQAAGSEITTAADVLLDLDLASLVASGWRKHAALTEAAERTLANPGSSEIVELLVHNITTTHRPSVDLLIDHVPVTTIHFELCFEFAVKGLVVTVRNGHVVNLHSGSCDVTGTLTAEGAQLASRRAHLELPWLIRWPLRIHPGDDLSPSDTGQPAPPTPPHRRKRRPIGSVGTTIREPSLHHRPTNQGRSPAAPRAAPVHIQAGSVRALLAVRRG
jgi:hypothetical protein